MSVSEAFSVPFLTLIKLCYTKALEWSRLVPGPEAKSSSEITNLPWLTVFLLLETFSPLALTLSWFSFYLPGCPSPSPLLVSSWLFDLYTCAVSGLHPYPLSYSLGPHQTHVHYKLLIC